MRIMSTSMLIEKNKLQSDHPFAHLFEVSIQGAPGPYRLTAYDQDVVFHGETYYRSPLTVDTLEDPTHASLVNLRVTVENVDQQVIALLENYWVFVGDPLWTVSIWTIDAFQPDETDYFAGEVFSVQQVTTDLVVGVFDLVAEGLTLGLLLPKRRFSSAQGFPFLPRR